MSIDWDKFPLATHYTPADRENFRLAGFWLIEGDAVKTVWVEERGGWTEFNAPISDCLANHRIVIERQSGWLGEGLPPVGMVCKMIGSKLDPETIDYAKYKNHIGKKVTIIAHHDVGSPVAVYAYEIGDGEFEYYSMIAGCFKPVSTPEQIAAKERDMAVEAMLSLDPYLPNTALGMLSRRDFCIKLHDAGYRKQATQ